MKLSHVLVLAELKMAFSPISGTYYVMFYPSGGRTPYSATTKAGVARMLTESHLDEDWLDLYCRIAAVDGAESEERQVDLANNDIPLVDANQALVLFYNDLSADMKVEMDTIMRCVKIYPRNRGAKFCLYFAPTGLAKISTHKAQLWWWVYNAMVCPTFLSFTRNNWMIKLKLKMGANLVAEQGVGNPLIPPVVAVPDGATPSFVVAPYVAPPLTDGEAKSDDD